MELWCSALLDLKCERRPFGLIIDLRIGYAVHLNKLHVPFPRSVQFDLTDALFIGAQIFADPQIRAVVATASSPVVGNQTVNLGVSGTNITAGDYTLSNSTITITDGSTMGSVAFTVVDDTVFEGTETATIAIIATSSGLSTGATMTQDVTITDNDAPPTFSVNDVSQAEGNTGSSPFTFQVTKTGASELTATVNVATVDGTAVAGSDYQAASETLTLSFRRNGKEFCCPGERRHKF